MSDNSAERFLRIAVDCERKAQEADLPVDQDAWMRIAAEWRALSQQMVDRAKKMEGLLNGVDGRADNTFESS